jgi:hypothetical protein
VLLRLKRADWPNRDRVIDGGLHYSSNKASNAQYHDVFERYAKRHSSCGRLLTREGALVGHFRNDVGEIPVPPPQFFSIYGHTSYPNRERYRAGITANAAVEEYR